MVLVEMHKIKRVAQPVVGQPFPCDVVFSLLDKRYATLDEIGEVLALEHAV